MDVVASKTRTHDEFPASATLRPGPSSLGTDPHRHGGDNPLPDDGFLGRVAWSSGRGRLCDADRDSRFAEDDGFLGRTRTFTLVDASLGTHAGQSLSVLLGSLGAEVPDLTERGAKKRGDDTSRPGTQVAIVSPDRLGGEYPVLHRLD